VDEDKPLPAMVFEPKEMSQLDTLDDEHSDIFKTALSRLLATELAEYTFAQIIDGLPTTASLRNFNLWIHNTNHPVIALNHVELCPGVIEKTRRIRDEFDPMSLTFKAEVCLAITLPTILLTLCSSSQPSNAPHPTRKDSS